MSNGKFTLSKLAGGLAKAKAAESLTKAGILTKIEKPRQKQPHHEHTGLDEMTTRFDLVADTAFHFFLIPFAIFVAAMAFFSGGLAAAFRKGLEILEGIRK